MKKWKLWLTRGVFTLIFGALAAQAYNLQIQHGDLYAERAYASFSGSKLSRGLIYFTDKKGNPIPAVLNKEYSVIFAVPIEIENPQETAKLMAPIVGKDESSLERSFSKKNDQYELVKEKAHPLEVNQVRALAVKGIYVRPQTFRFYPFQNSASHLLGFLSHSEDGNLSGRYGLELQFEKELSGVAQTSGKPRDLHLTIDRNIQSEAEQILGQLMRDWSADGGTFLVQEPSSGKILAMASAPNFDPNDYAKYQIKDFINPALQLVYEPGSVFKIITMAAGIDADKITPLTTYTDSGSVTLNNRTIRNWDLKAHGVQTMANVIEKSLNTGAIFAEIKTGHDVFTSYVKKFGFGEKTGINLPGDIKGNIANLEKGKDVNYATASFGQGISVTPLQMISSFSTIANGGVLLRPIFFQDEKPEVVRRVISSETARKIAQMMVSAVDVNMVAHIREYSIAGKTGTAFIPDFKKGGYTDRVINTYAGFASAFDARFTVLIKLDNPSGAPLAGLTVVPAFKRMTQFLLNYYEIPPDREVRSGDL